MNSLHTLNERGAEQASYTDNRSDGPIFSRTNTTNRTKTIEQNDDHAAVVGINVLDVVNPSAVNLYYEIDVSSLSGTTVTWSTVPTGCVVSNPSTGVYRITGIDNGSIWKQVRSPTIDIPASFTGTFVYTSTLHYTDPTLGTAESKSWTVTVTVTDVVVLTTPVEQFFVPGETQTINAPTITTEKTGTYTVTVTPTTIADISTMQATIADPDGVTSFNGTTKVLTIEGTRAQVVQFLAAFSATFTDSATDNTFTYALTCTNTDVPSDSEPQTITEAEYWFPPGAAEYGSGVESTLANPGRIVNLADELELYELQITPADPTLIQNLKLADIDYFTRDSADTASNQSTDPDTTAFSMDISDGGRLVVNMREDQDAGVVASEFNVYDYDLAANTLTHVETISLSSEPDVFDINISRNGTYVLHGGTAKRYTWNGTTFGSGASLGTGADIVDQSDDGTVAVAFAGSTLGLLYDSGSGFTLQQSITQSGSSIAISGDGLYVALGDNLNDTVYIYERTGGVNLTLQTTLTGVANEHFGMTLELNSDGSQLYIGAPADPSVHSGKLYIYSRSGTSWSEDTAAGSPLVSPVSQFNYFGGANYPDWQSFHPWVKTVIDETDTILSVSNGSGSVAIFKKTSGVWSNIDLIDTHRGFAMKSGSTIYDNVMFQSDGTTIYWYRRQYGQLATWNGLTLTIEGYPKTTINRAIDGVRLTTTATVEDIELEYRITLEDSSQHSSTQTVTHNEGIA